MASYRSFPSQSSFVPPPPNQNPIPQPPPPSSQQRATQYPPPPNRTFPGAGQPSTSYNHQQHHSAYTPSYAAPPPPPPQQQYSYVQQQHSSYTPNQPQASMYYQYNNSHSVPPPPPPPSSPPPPPPSNPLPPPPTKETKPTRGAHNDSAWPTSKHPPPTKHHKPSSSAPLPHGRLPHVPNGPAGRVETEEEKKARKKREYEKQKLEEKHRHSLKESQNTVLQKTQMLSSAIKAHGSMAGSRLGDKRTPFLTGERIENRLKKPTTFLCKFKFRNELPDPTAQPKLLSMNTNKDQYTKYTITSLEKMYKPKLFVEPDLGIPLDLLDISVYNPPSVRPPLALEDEELLRDAEFTTPVKQNGIRRKDRPDDKGVSWLVKTQYISPLSTDQAKTSLTEKQAKELRENKGGRNLLENLNDRQSQIKAIEASFEACKAYPVHATNKKLQPVEIMPLLPDFDRYDDLFVLSSFDNDPTADSEAYSKLDRSARDELESQAIMKSFVGAGSDKFLAYMVPSADELWKDIYDENEDVTYTWVREYQYDIRTESADHPTTYLVSFHEDAARYLPLATKLVLRKKRATEGRSNEEVEHYPVPSRVTVRHRSKVARVEVEESGGYMNQKDVTPNLKRGRSSNDDAHEARPKAARMDDVDNFSEAEESE